MSHTMSLPDAVAELCRSLQPAHQSSLLDYAEFLKAQEAQAGLNIVDEEDEAEWDAQLADPEKVANFARWADESLARDRPRPIDPAHL